MFSKGTSLCSRPDMFASLVCTGTAAGVHTSSLELRHLSSMGEERILQIDDWSSRWVSKIAGGRTWVKVY